MGFWLRVSHEGGLLVYMCIHGKKCNVAAALAFTTRPSPRVPRPLSPPSPYLLSPFHEFIDPVRAILGPVLGVADGWAYVQLKNVFVEEGTVVISTYHW